LCRLYFVTTHTNIRPDKKIGICTSSNDKTESGNTPFPNTPNENIVKQLHRLDLSKVCKSNLRGGTYDARVMRVYDGDTMTVVMQVSHAIEDPHRAMQDPQIAFKAYQIRLYGCDTPEMNARAQKSDTQNTGPQAREEALRYIGAAGVIGKKRGKQENECFQNNPIILSVKLMSEESGKPDKYGRELAHIFVPGKPKSLTAHLIHMGYAYEYYGDTKK
jgi:endonuclease YncB( thermonuclease family)